MSKGFNKILDFMKLNDNEYDEYDDYEDEIEEDSVEEVEEELPKKKKTASSGLHHPELKRHPQDGMMILKIWMMSL